MKTTNTAPVSADIPGVLIFPPAVAVGAPIVAIVLQWLVPIRLLPPFGVAWSVALGVLLLAVTAYVAISGNLAFRRAGTNVNPYRPALVLVASGPFRWTRNPMYLGMVTQQLGLAFAFSLDWALVAAPVVWAILHFGVVRREEAYLTRRFGQPYTDYLQRTRRWI